MSEYEPAINEVQVPVLHRDICNAWMEHQGLNVTEGMICAGYPEGGKDACQVNNDLFLIFILFTSGPSKTFSKCFDFKLKGKCRDMETTQ